jgi:hypothetical protein
MDETPIFASVERDLQVTYDDLAEPQVEQGATSASAQPGASGAARP